ncbi:hypothetical protein ACFYO1_08125 [Nocardia sp. NPDC006044]|uniref:hypothetical protein n=1 Tax=Nocardia sp. NPDC006044 TaxID=3364306 RepID=UPI00368EFF46
MPAPGHDDTPHDDIDRSHYPDAAGVDERAMRADFARMIRLSEAQFHARTDHEIDQLATRTKELMQQWTTGRAEEASNWRYLSDAHYDWRHAPGTMQRMLDNIEHAQAGGFDPGLTDVELRSQRQAHDLNLSLAAERSQGRPPLTQAELENELAQNIRPSVEMGFDR